MIHQVKIRIGDEDLILETGKMAKQANGAVFARYGGSVVIATACCSEQERDEISFIPLSVEYNEKYYAAGKIPGGFIKREGRPKDREILVSRLIDRPMRPLFSKRFKREIQIIPTTLSTDQINPPDVVAMVAAAAAVTISDIPFDGPIGAVRIGYLDGAYIVNPTYEQIERCDLEIVVSGSEKGITMVEGGAREIDERVMVGAIEEAYKSIKELCRVQRELAALAGKPKMALPEEVKYLSPELAAEIRASSAAQMEEACFVSGKMNRSAALKTVRREAIAAFAERIPDEAAREVDELFEQMEYEIVRRSIVTRKIRTDGRGPEDIRDITCEIDILPRTHGSALFTRGETQALAVITLGTVRDEKIMDDIEGDVRKNLMLHYNFPPFSVGETGRLGTGRREVGHGHLAERAIKNLLPQKADFPYTIRIVSEILESNGSSSMATVCGSTLALQQAGVPMQKPVAGIAMGLVQEGEDAVVLSDILGEEDHLGDMDFKVAGTVEGITAFQMDIKIDSVDSATLSRALDQARRGRLKILETMKQTIAEPRRTISDYAPKIITMTIDPDKIGAVIGPGGKSIKSISEKSEADINIENDGTVTIYCRDKDGALEAQRLIASIIEEPEVGKWYPGTVKRIVDFGAFIEFLPGKEGLCHISRIAKERVGAVTDVLHEGQEVQVKLFEIDKIGRMNLTMVEGAETSPSSRPPAGRPGGDSRHGRPRSRDDHSGRPARR